MTYPTYGSPLLDYVQKLVQERPANLTIRKLAAEMDRTPVWLSEFACGKAKNPSAVVIERLYVRLSGKQLVSHVSEHTEQA